MLARAIEVFGSKQIANRWFRKPNPALKKKAPLEVVTSARGRKEVEAILGRIEQGVIS
jgi:putative toxin-antitoxin system antitoxin component (TIGR02293 family)